MCAFSAAQAVPGKTASPIENVAIRSQGVDIKLRSVWPYPVVVWVCDTPRRLNQLGYDLEAYSGRNWERLKTPDHLGDLKPELLEIGEGRTDLLLASVYPRAFGGSSGMTLRIVIRAWRTERDVLGLIHVTSQKPLLITSPAFVLKSPQNNSQR